MFLQYYGLREQPFGVTPDPRFLYFSATHREALASLFYGIESGCGFLALIAPPGMGKTTLLFHLLEKLRGSAQTVFLFQTQCGSREFFRYLLTDLGVDASEQNLARMHESLNAVLMRNARVGRRVVLVIDEAQNLDDSVLETVRLLSDFETPQAKLLQIVLAGQPQLADKLSNPALTQLRQRISIVSRLHPFTRVETMVHIEYRLCTAGYSGPPLFKYDATELIAAHSGGIPRIINNICFNAMTLGFAKRQKQIDASVVSEVLADLDIEGLGSHPLAPGLTAGDSLSNFDGMSPSDDESYEEFHTAVRSAWGKGRESKPQSETPPGDPIEIKPGRGNHAPKSIFQTAAGSQALSGSPFELDAESIANGNAAGSVSPASNTGAHPQPNRQGESVSFAERRNREEVLHLNFEPLSAGARTPSNGVSIWGRAISRLWQNNRKKSVGEEEKKRAASGRTLLIVAAVLGAGGFLLRGRAHAVPEPSHGENRKIPALIGNNIPALAPINVGKKSVEISGSKNASPLHATAGESPEVITVESGQTLSQVSVRYLGRFNNEITQKIQGLNPAIKDPNVIFAGTHVRLPAPSGAIDRSAAYSAPDQNPEERTR